MRHIVPFLSVLLALFLITGGCGSGGTDGPSQAEDLGLTQYAGLIDPVEHAVDGDVTTYTFDPVQGPRCMRGADYFMGVRDTGSDDLVIFLQGGGACWSAFCLAVTAAPEGVARVDILNPNLAANPVAGWNVVYLPYCDGSMFLGDAEYDDDINGNGTRYHQGLANLTGALEAASMRFPAPRRILLAGSSGGAYGLLLAGPLVRHYYPGSELILMADSGIGLGQEGEPGYINTILDEFNLQRFMPTDCDDCLDKGHLTGIIAWVLRTNPDVRVGLFSSWYDSILAATFLQVPYPQFADSLAAQTGEINREFPDRFRRFIVDGTMHTTLLGDPSGIIGNDLMAVELPPNALVEMAADLVIGDLAETRIGDFAFSDWLTGLVDNDLNAWVDTLEERGEPPSR